MAHIFRRLVLAAGIVVVGYYFLFSFRQAGVIREDHAPSGFISFQDWHHLMHAYTLDDVAPTVGTFLIEHPDRTSFAMSELKPYCRVGVSRRAILGSFWWQRFTYPYTHFSLLGFGILLIVVASLRRKRWIVACVLGFSLMCALWGPVGKILWQVDYEYLQDFQCAELHYPEVLSEFEHNYDYFPLPESSRCVIIYSRRPWPDGMRCIAYPDSDVSFWIREADLQKVLASGYTLFSVEERN